MLVNFSVENFRSFGEEQTLNLIASKAQKGHESHCIPIADTGEQVLRTSLIYGANAAGKSNLVRAIAFAHDLILEGAGPFKRIALNRFRFTKDSGKPSSFEFRFLVDGELFIYGFDVTPEAVNAEWLSRVGANGREHDVFTRDGEKLCFGDFKQFGEQGTTSRDALEALKLLGTRPNQLLLNKLYDLPQSRIGEILHKVVWWFAECLTVIEPDTSFSPMIDLLDKDQQFRKFAATYLSSVETGIGDLTVEQAEINAESIPKQFLDGLQSLNEVESASLAVGPGMSIHLDPKDPSKVIRRNLAASHHVGRSQFSLPFQEESDGTQRLLHLLPALYHLKNGCKVFVIDELDRSLHPLLSHSILQFFVNACPGACQQLIVTSHETYLLDQELLRRDEIWFVEKDNSQQTRLFSLAELGVRKDLRLERGYLQGRFGGVPSIHGMDRLRDLIECE